ncbi:MAG: type III-B CRISPR module RAMP protein Cmr6 [Verrucomicrobia bacterium]|nr:type III-B CRISPR module RAMP protein Cmr6 [Verrucomicrobiota bacterium]
MRLNIRPQQLAATAPARTAIGALEQGQVEAPAWSLFLDKLSFEQPTENDERDERPGKTRALFDVRNLYSTETVQAELAHACDRKLRWLLTLQDQAGKERFRDVLLVNESRLLVHLGRASVLENVGLCVDRTTGLPWIPGTAEKGVLSTWALWEGYFGQAGTLGEIQMPPKPGGRPGETMPLTRAWVAVNGPDRSTLAAQVFGDDSPTGSKGAGGVVFVGGFPDSCPTLGLDIVNPHYSEERDERTGRVIRVDDKRNLTPNIFLAIEPGAVWHFVFHLRAGVSKDAGLLEAAGRWLKESLTSFGLGAKTAAGFGRFRELTAEEADTVVQRQRQRQEARQRARQLQSVSADDRPYVEFVSSVSDWDELVRDLAQLDAARKTHVKRFLSTEEGQKLVNSWRASRGGRRQVQRLQEAGLL